MNMPRPSMLWIYGLIGAFIIGYYVFGDVNDTPVPSDWATVERMVEKGEVEKICRAIDLLHGYSVGSVVPVSEEDMQNQAVAAAGAELEKN